MDEGAIASGEGAIVLGMWNVTLDRVCVAFFSTVGIVLYASSISTCVDVLNLKIGGKILPIYPNLHIMRKDPVYLPDFGRYTESFCLIARMRVLYGKFPYINSSTALDINVIAWEHYHCQCRRTNSLEPTGGRVTVETKIQD